MPLRITIHDFVGHAFQTQLSVELARRGHAVQHISFAGFRSPNEHPSASAGDPETFFLDPVMLHGEYPKYQFLRRYWMDRRYLQACLARISAFQPQVVLSANASPAIQAGILRACHRNSITFINWVQDCYGIAAEKIFARRLGPAGRWLGRYIRRQEDEVVYSSDRVVLISPDFFDAFPHLHPGKATVIENWAPLGDLPARPRINPWSLQQGLTGKRILLYSGTLGLKHNPELLVQLAADLVGWADVAVVVVSEGLGRAYLERRRRELRLSNLLLFDFQPLAALRDVTASAEVLLAMVGKDAGAYSVPSKILTYLCAGRAMLLAVPRSNLAARIVTRSGAGLVVDPDDREGFVRSARELLLDPEGALKLADSGRAYAVSMFDIAKIADRFEAVLFESLSSGRSIHRAEATAATAGY